MTPRRPSITHELVYMSLKRRYRKVTDTVGFDDSHLMAINPKVEHRKGAGVHDAESIRLSRLKW